jgi:type IV secretion system protein VirB4
MRRTAAVKRAFREAGALSDVMPVVGFVDDMVFFTKSGHVGVVLALAGVDYECLDAAQREAVTLRFEAALRLWDERTRVYQYVVKRHRPPDVPTSHPHPGVDRILQRRDAYLRREAPALFSVSLYLVVTAAAPPAIATWPAQTARFLRAPVTTARAWLSTTHTVRTLDGELQRRATELRHKADACVLQLADTVHPRLLTREDAFTFFRRLANYDPPKADAVRWRPDAIVDVDMCDSALECHRTHLRLDEAYVRVLTLKAPPGQTVPLLFQALYELPSNLLLVSAWQRRDMDAMRQEIHARQRHFHQARVALRSYVTESNAAPGDLLVDDSAVAIVRDLGAALTELALHGRYVGAYTLTVVLWDDDPASLERSVGLCLKAFAAHDAQVTDERYNLLHAWLAVFPGNDAYDVRSLYLLNTNAADLALLFAQDPGQPRNAHLGREAVAVLESTHATPYHLNLHVEDVGHTLVLGATGSGKSFLLNFLVAHLQRYNPRTLIFDLGGSYDGLTSYFGGHVLRVTRDRPSFTLNPFCLPPTPANRQFLFTFVKVLLQAGGQYAMTRADDQALYEQIETLYVLDPDQRRLFTLANILPRPLAQQLQRWVEGGQYADVFDHVDDTVTLAPFQTIDFEGLDGTPLVLEPLLFYFLHRATATVLDPALAATLKVFVLDEAWRFLRDPTIRAYVTDALKTWRKKNACVLLATQSSEDLERSDLLRVAVESCPTKIFLANPNIDRAAYQTLFHLNDTEAARIATLVPRQQFLLKQPGVAKVLTLRVDPANTTLFSTARRR